MSSLFVCNQKQLRAPVDVKGETQRHIQGKKSIFSALAFIKESMPLSRDWLFEREGEGEKKA